MHNYTHTIRLGEQEGVLDSMLDQFIRTYFLQSSTQKMQLYTNRIYKKIIILLKYINKMNSDMSEN